MSQTHLMDCVSDFNCSSNATGGKSGPSCPPINQVGGFGTTIWGPLDLEIPPLTNVGGSFTCTQPQCYQGANVCNITYTIHTEEDSSGAYVGPIGFAISSSFGTFSNDRYHSKLAGDDCTETQDVSLFENSNGDIIFDDTGSNTLSFTNNDPKVTVWIKGLQIVRGYGMCQLPCDSSQQCNGGMCNGSGVPCSTNQTKSGSNDIAPRQDYPCNYENCGGLSYTAYYWDNHNGRILNRETTYTWTWTNPNATFGIYNSYVGPSHCLFNLNNVNTCDDQGNAADAITSDVPFQLSLDNTHWKTFYHVKDGNYTMARGVDLATDSVLSQYYNDHPGGTNILYLKIPTNPDPALIHLNDGGDGRVNLYRTYQTQKQYLVNVYSSTGGTVYYYIPPNTYSQVATLGVNAGDTPQFVMMPNTGNVVTAIYVDGNYVGNGSSHQFNAINQNPNIISVYFGSSNNPVSCYPINAGTVSINGETFTANAYAGYTFGYWYANYGANGYGNIYGNPLTNFSLTGVTALVANFNCTITASAGLGGSISPSGSVQVPAGTNQTFTVTANSGYSIFDVTTTNPNQDQGAVSTYTFTDIGGPASISATFVETYTITVTQTSNGTISPGTTSVPRGGSQTFTITPSTGYSIASLTIDGSSLGAASSYTFNNVQASHTISAIFMAHTTENLIVALSSSSSASGFILDQTLFFPNYFNTLQSMQQQNFSINTFTGIGSGDDYIYSAVSQGFYDLGVVGRLPTDEEWADITNLQLWAVGYGGDPTEPFYPSKMFWMITNNVLSPTSAADMAVGVFISLIRGASMQRGNCYQYPADMAGMQPEDNKGYPVTPQSNQTWTMPDGSCNMNDISYFTAYYQAYAAQQIYNPYLDFTASGQINFNDVTAFNSYYQAWNNTCNQQIGNQSVSTGSQTSGNNLNTSSGQGTANEDVELSLVGPSVLPNAGESFTVTLHVDNVTGLWGWDCSLSWDPNILRLTDIAEGSFFSSGGSTLFLNSLNDPLVLSNGILRDMCDALLSLSNISGSGDLANLNLPSYEQCANKHNIYHRRTLRSQQWKWKSTNALCNKQS